MQNSLAAECLWLGLQARRGQHHQICTPRAGDGRAAPNIIFSHRRVTQPVFLQTLSICDREHGANRQVGATRKAGSRAGTCWEVQDGYTWSVTKSSANNALAPFLLQNKDLEDICKISFNPYFQSFKKKAHTTQRFLYRHWEFYTEPYV